MCFLSFLKALKESGWSFSSDDITFRENSYGTLTAAKLVNFGMPTFLSGGICLGCISAAKAALNAINGNEDIYFGTGLEKERESSSMDLSNRKESQYMRAFSGMTGMITPCGPNICDH